ncbi:hypothetical protein [Fervidobacterium sp.]
MSDPRYYLISVSNKENLDLCLEYNLAGFLSSQNGLWTFLDIDVGDYVSFLYGARVKNLYKVIRKVAYKNAESLPPWKPITFRESGNTYAFPYRLELKLEREFDESMVRPEFAYVAEDLLLRGGYRKTHFQTDATTLSYVSTLGRSTQELIESKIPDTLKFADLEFVPKIVFSKAKSDSENNGYTVAKFNESILQSLLKRKLSAILKDVLKYFGSDKNPDEFEILSEKALSRGFVDLFIKLKHPVGKNQYILVEVKNRKASSEDFEQIIEYIRDFDKEGELLGGIIIASGFPSKGKLDTVNILRVKFFFHNLDESKEYYYQDLLDKLELTIVENDATLF